MHIQGFIALILVIVCSIKAENEDPKNSWKKKNIRDYTDHDLEKLYEQWEEDEEPLPVDELPEWDPRKPRPGIDLSDMSKFGDTEDFLKASKKGQSVMMFVKVSDAASKTEAEEITSIWQTGLWNTHIHCDRYMIEDDRALLMFKDGSLAWEAKDYLLEQERCLEVQLEQKTYHGYHTPEGKKEKAEKEKSKKSSETKNKKKKKDKKKKKEEL